MKTFIEYLTQVQKVYEFKVKVANIDPKDHLPQIKAALAGYVVETLGTVKSLPIMENHMDFPNINNAEIYMFEVAIKYPLQANQLRELISETLGAPLNQVYVVPAAHPEELWRHGEGELRKFTQGENVLTQSYPAASLDQAAASHRHATAAVVPKIDTKPYKFEIAGSDNTIGGEKDPSYAKTTNSIAQGRNAPFTKQVQIPNPNDKL